jgi:hypothetical protein
MTKRPIDIQRDSAKSATIGVDGDTSRITDMIPMKGGMIFLKEKAAYTYVLADHIDPDRTNEKIPDTQQRILDIGSAHPIVAKVLLTANTLFRRELFDESFDRDAAINFALELVKDLAAMEAMRAELESLQNTAWEKSKNQEKKTGSFALPSVGNLEAKFESFVQKLGHVYNSLEAIAKLFYGDKLTKYWVDSLIKIVRDTQGEDSGAYKYLAEIGPYLLKYNALRNAVEHPKSDNFVQVHDFRLMPSGEIFVPHCDLTLRNHGVLSGTIISLMQRLIEGLPITIETFLACICDSNFKRSESGFDVFVFEFPEERRVNKLQRYNCAVNMNGQIAQYR